MSLDDFIEGFADETGYDRQEADEQWASFSRMLSDAEIRRIEAGGYDAGVEEAKKFRKLYPEENDGEK